MNLEETYIFECCSICGEDLTSIENIWVSIDTDTYVCSECYIKLDLIVIKCRGLNH